MRWLQYNFSTLVGVPVLYIYIARITYTLVAYFMDIYVFSIISVHSSLGYSELFGSSCTHPYDIIFLWDKRCLSRASFSPLNSDFDLHIS
jgi:cytosine/uracil/thiamine/allantoin permease